MREEEFSQLLSEHLREFGGAVLTLHAQAVHALRSELAEVSQRLEASQTPEQRDDPKAWVVPFEPVPQRDLLGKAHSRPALLHQLSRVGQLSPRLPAVGRCVGEHALGSTGDDTQLVASGATARPRLRRGTSEPLVPRRGPDSEAPMTLQMEGLGLRGAPNGFRRGQTDASLPCIQDDECGEREAVSPQHSAKSDEETDGDDNDDVQLRFVAREVWTRRGQMTRLSVQPIRDRKANAMLISRKSAEGPKDQYAVGLAAKFMVHPSSAWRLTWSLVSVILLLYDVLMIPVDISFHLPDTLGKYIFEMGLATFWLVDLLIHFVTGVYRDGYLDMRPKMVAIAYLKTWFFFDCFLVCSEFAWLLLSLGPLGESISLLRVARTIRLLRLLRIARLSQLSNDLLLFAADGIVLFVGLLRASLQMLMMVHICSCAWYWAGSLDKRGWVYRQNVDKDTIFNKYLYCWNWTISVLHGTHFVHPITVPEQVFASLYSLLALFMYVFFIGKMVQAVEAMEEKHHIQMQRLCRHYLRRRNLSPELAMKLKKYFNRNTANLRKTLNLRERLEHEARLVEELPAVLQMDLYEEVRRPLLEQTRMFNDLKLAQRDSRVLRELCHEAITCEVSLPGELVFTMGDPCSRTLVVESGRMSYCQGLVTDVEAASASLNTWMMREVHSAVSERGETEGVGVDEAGVGHERSGEENLRRNSSGPRRIKLTGYQNNNKPFGTKGSFSDRDTDREFQERQMGRGVHVSEAVLWTKWVHCGDLIADSDATTLAMEAQRFAEVICNHERARVQAMHYVQGFMAHLNELSNDDAFTDLLQVPSELFFHARTSRNTHTILHPSHHLLFLSHYKKEAGTEATLLEEEVCSLIRRDPSNVANDFRRPVFLDSQDLQDLSRLEKHVRRSHYLILLLTPGVLSRPWCLLEIVTAVRAGVQILPVEIQRPGMHFKYPDERYFRQLSLGETLTKDAVKLLQSKGVQLQELPVAVKKVFLKIALPFSPQKSVNIREAELREILSRCEIRQTAGFGSQSALWGMM